MSYVLKVDDLSKKYGNTTIFENVSFVLRRGETLGLFGKSGSGKSTIGKCLIKLEKATKGEIWFQDTNISSMPERKFRKMRSKIQMIFQHPEISFNPKYRLFKSISEPLAYHTNKKTEDVFNSLEELIRETGLKKEILYRYPDQLSGGELQRAMMVKIYSLNPDIIISDEPTSMLDVSVQAQVLSLMKRLQLKNKTSMILISHDPHVILNMCDHIGVLEEGKLRITDRNTFSDKYASF